MNVDRLGLTDYAKRNRLALSDSRSISFYYQLFRLLERFILERHLRPNDRFPSEEAIAAAFNVSRPTASRATRELIDCGWLHRERGRGTFVAREPYVESALLTDEVSLSSQFQNDVRLTSQAVYSRTAVASNEAARALNVPRGTPIIELRRLRSIDHRPVLVSDSSLPAARFPALEEKKFVDGSLFRTLRERYSVPVARCERWLEASGMFSQEIAGLLQIPLLAPILLVRGLAYTAEGEAVACMQAYVREGVSFQATGRAHANGGSRTAKTYSETVEQHEGRST